jgi:hypothetical protein
VVALLSFNAEETKGKLLQKHLLELQHLTVKKIAAPVLELLQLSVGEVFWTLS